jgi:hypothetical protein
VFAESAEYSWFIKRNGNKRPLLQKGQEIINTIEENIKNSLS